MPSGLTGSHRIAYSRGMTRETTPISVNQTIRAFRRLPAEQAEVIQKAAELLQAKTGLKLVECLQVYASLGMLLIRRGL